MVYGSHKSRQSQWSPLFYACRTALRTKAGVGVSELLLPLLVLDRICFGSGEEKAVLLQEFRDAMTFKGEWVKQLSMGIGERQKIVNALFTVIDTFTFWSEVEVEKKQTPTRRSSTSRAGVDGLGSSGGDWPVDDSILAIEDVLKEVPLTLQARAAERVGMYARSLRLLEMASRATVADQMYNIAEDTSRVSRAPKSSAGECPVTELDLLKDVLAALGNYETVSVLSEIGTNVRVSDSIRLKEASDDWGSALQEYERARQVANTTNNHGDLERGTLRCLLELGQLER